MYNYFVEFVGTIFFVYVILATGNPLAIGAALALGGNTRQPNRHMRNTTAKVHRENIAVNADDVHSRACARFRFICRHTIHCDQIQFRDSDNIDDLILGMLDDE